MSQEDIHETPSSTPNFRTELAEQLAELVPEAIADGKVDVTKLQELLDGDAAEGNERFGLFWPGKKRALRVAQEPTTATLKPDFENSKDWDTTQNVFIEGDNLEVLKILQRHYHGKIKMIYIDPPYNTGKEFIYPDNYKEGLDTYLEWTRQVNEEGKKLSSNSESEGRYHSNWLNMMYPRLKLARNLLTNDGVIFLSIDDHELSHVRKICDEIFGEANFIGILPRQTSVFGKNDEPYVASAHDYVLIYQRGGLRRLSRNPEAGKDLFVDRDDIGLYRLGAVLDASSLQYSSNLDFEISLNGKVFTPSIFEGKRTCWRWGREKVQFGIQHGLIVEKNGRLYTKTYRNHEVAKTPSGYAILPKEAGGTYKTNVLMDNEYGNRRATRTIADLGLSFDSPKPVSLPRKLMDMVPQTSGEEFIVLDFFAGSSTTAHAVFEANSSDLGSRSFIEVQLPEPMKGDTSGTLADLSRERIRRAGDLIAGKKPSLESEGLKPLDTGFRAFTLCDTNFSKWRAASDIDAGELEQQLLNLADSSDDGATPDDLLTEILLKQGFSLTERIEPREIAGLDVRAVLQSDGDPAVLAYLDEHVKPSLDQLREMVAEIPGGKIIVLEDAFQGDDELKTNLAQMCKTNNIELWTA